MGRHFIDYKLIYNSPKFQQIRFNVLLKIRSISQTLKLIIIINYFSLRLLIYNLTMATKKKYYYNYNKVTLYRVVVRCCQLINSFISYLEILIHHHHHPHPSPRFQFSISSSLFFMFFFHIYFFFFFLI